MKPEVSQSTHLQVSRGTQDSFKGDLKSFNKNVKKIVSVLLKMGFATWNITEVTKNIDFVI